MNFDIKKFIKDTTGVSVPEENDPYNYWTYNDNNYYFSISGLSFSFNHKGGILVYQGFKAPRHKEDFRVFRIVAYTDINCVLGYRLCKAHENVDYEAFVVGYVLPYSRIAECIMSAKSIAPYGFDEIVQKLSEMT